MGKLNNDITKACYTGNVSILEKYYKNNNEIKTKITEIILLTNNKINTIIDQLNKDTNFIFKEIFDNRNNYCCNNNCTKTWMLSCEDLKKFNKLTKDKKEEELFYDSYKKLITCSQYYKALIQINELLEKY